MIDLVRRENSDRQSASESKITTCCFHSFEAFTFGDQFLDFCCACDVLLPSEFGVRSDQTIRIARHQTACMVGDVLWFGMRRSTDV